MATLTIRNVDSRVKERLRVRAARHGRSMEAEPRSILGAAPDKEGGERGPDPAEAIRRRRAPASRRAMLRGSRGAASA